MEEAPPGRCAMLWSSFAARVLVAEQTGGLMGCWEQTQLCRGDTILGRVTGWESCRKIGHEGKGDALAQKSRESPPPQIHKEEKANVDLEGYLKHPAPEPGCDLDLHRGTFSQTVRLIGL
eukprot:1136172-Pelagomonas_calceolata.AAC.3